MVWQAGDDDDPDGGSAAESGLPGGHGPTEPGNTQPWLNGFAAGGTWSTSPPSAALAVALESASGPEWRCPGATREELFAVLRQWQAMESWAAAGKLGVLRSLMREEDLRLPGTPHHGDLPDGWSKPLTREVSLALAMPAVSAENLMGMAWDMQERLPETGALLASGALTFAKAKAVDEGLLLLSEDDAAAAESLIAADLPGKTYGQVAKLVAQAAITVDPDSAAKRREDAERNRSRVTMTREPSGAAALSGRDLPTAETLAANARVCARAGEYKESQAFRDARMDQLRAAAYLDMLNGITLDERLASGCLPGTAPGPDNCGSVTNLPDDDSPDCGGPGGDSPDGDSPESGGSSPSAPPVPPECLPKLSDLVLPLASLLGLAERPGEGHGLGPLDPELCRALAAAAVASQRTSLCVTVTAADGVAIGHGCARPIRNASGATRASPDRRRVAQPTLPSRVNLTITSDRLAEIGAASAQAPPGAPLNAAWSLTRQDGPGPPGGYGVWTLTLPGGRNLTVHLDPVPTYECDHRHESRGYQPNDTLRHLVQVRDYECTFPTCSRHARESDFEHALPYAKGGRTCACNAGARSRQCHRTKQSPGWNVTQPRPGWHLWTTPAGLSYTQSPKRYPVLATM